MGIELYPIVCMIYCQYFSALFSKVDFTACQNYFITFNLLKGCLN